MRKLMIFWVFCSHLVHANNDIYKRSEAENLLVRLQEDYKPTIVDGKKEPSKIFQVEKYREGLNGIDENNNHLRDDIELYINRQVSNPFIRIVLREYAKSYLKIIKNYKTLEVEKLQKELKSTNAISLCFIYLETIPDLDKDIWKKALSYKIEEQIFNSKDRKLAANEILAKSTVIEGIPNITSEIYRFCPEKIKKMYPLKGFK